VLSNDTFDGRERMCIAHNAGQTSAPLSSLQSKAHLAAVVKRLTSLDVTYLANSVADMSHPQTFTVSC
jgi:hypothetical protein